MSTNAPAPCSPEETRSPRRLGQLLAWAALVWTLIVAGGLLTVPLVSEVTTSSGSSAPATTTTSEQTLLESEGPSVLLVVLVPTILAAVAIVGGRSARPRRLTVGALTGLGCVLALLSIGLVYLPAAALLVLSGLLTGPRGVPGNGSTQRPW